MRPEVLISTINIYLITCIWRNIVNRFESRLYTICVRSLLRLYSSLPVCLCSHSPICTFMCVYIIAFARVQLRVLCLHHDVGLCVYVHWCLLSTVLLVYTQEFRSKLCKSASASYTQPQAIILQAIKPGYEGTCDGQNQSRILYNIVCTCY